MQADDVLRRLAAYRSVPSPVPDGLRAAAVLVPLRRVVVDALEVLLTRRSSELLSHAGQVAFPGGGVDPHDIDVRAAALRETHEELGLPPSCIELVACLDPLASVTGYHITPVVGLVDPAAVIVPNPMEVARVFAVPLEVLLDESRWRTQTHAYQGREHQVWHLDFDGEDIWGATAYMLRGMLGVLRGG
jgi:8-oxo-dGTP pyrophosphatase MutT (NUDIX family)